MYAFRFEKLSIRKAAGMIIGFAGVFLCVTGGSASFLEGGFSIQGEGAMLLAAFASAVAGCFIKLFSQKEHLVGGDGARVVAVIFLRQERIHADDLVRDGEIGRAHV